MRATWRHKSVTQRKLDNTNLKAALGINRDVSKLDTAQVTKLLATAAEAKLVDFDAHIHPMTAVFRITDLPLTRQASLLDVHFLDKRYAFKNNILSDHEDISATYDIRDMVAQIRWRVEPEPEPEEEEEEEEEGPTTKDLSMYTISATVPAGMLLFQTYTPSIGFDGVKLERQTDVGDIRSVFDGLLEWIVPPVRHIGQSSSQQKQDVYEAEQAMLMAEIERHNKTYQQIDANYREQIYREEQNMVNRKLREFRLRKQAQKLRNQNQNQKQKRQRSK